MPPTTSTALSPTDTFAERHLGPGRAEQAKMLSELGFSTLDDLTAAAVPAAIRSPQPLDLPEALGESATTAELREMRVARTESFRRSSVSAITGRSPPR